jgi:asparagine synthase (glutamine-hydrolysing)
MPMQADGGNRRSGAPGAWLGGFSTRAPGSAPGTTHRGLELLAWEGASSPSIFEADSLTAIFDGVLYERAELASQLGADTSASDAELALRAWRRWDDGALDRIKGLFAFVIADSATRRVLAARDPLGIYPLFYAESAGLFLASTSIELLIRHPSVSRAVNRPALAGLLCHHWPDGEETFFAGVRRVPAGHALSVGPAGRRVFRHWDPAPPDQPMQWVSHEEFEQFEALFRQAVARCLTLGQTGVFLSGGLDSVSVALIAADEARRRSLPLPRALSMTFVGEPDEERIQRGVASQLHLIQTLLPFKEAAGPEGIVMSALELSAQWPWPLLNPWRPAYRQLGLAGKELGVQAAMTGEGGDEWLALSSQYAADLLRRLDFGGLWRMGALTCRSYQASPYAAARMLLRHGPRTLAMAALRTVLERTAPWVIRARRREQHRRSRPAWVAPDPELRREMDRRADQEVDEARRRPKPRGFYLRNVRGIFTAISRSMELEESFELGRSIGIRMLQPFWDADLVAFLYRTPPEYLVWNGRTKGPIRRLVAERLPGLGFESQRKVTIGTVWRDMMAAEVPRAWQKMGGLTALPALGLVDLTMLERAMALRSWHAFPLTAALNVEAWLRPRL